MLRSLIAVIVAVFVGLVTAKFIEGAGAAIAAVTPQDSSYQLVLLVSWFSGALAAGAIAILIGRKWAPVGVIASSAMMLSAIEAMVSASLVWFMWPGSIIAIGLGGVAAIKLTSAHFEPPRQAGKGLFE